MNLTPNDACLNKISEVKSFIEDKIIPLEIEVLKNSRNDIETWSHWKLDHKIESLKKETRERGLWNFFLPELPNGLSNLDYAYLAEETGRSLIAPEIFNCNAPDSGNMEVIWKYGSKEQQETWLTPLLEGEIRSAFCMTEPDVASSDATNMEATIEEDGDEIILKGKKWWCTGLGHPNCRVLIFMGRSSTTAEKHRQHSMVLVPMETKGVKVTRMLPVFGTFDAPYGHGEIEFENVRLPKESVIGELGDGFSIAQGRLGPGRVHHCMRLIGAAQRAFEMMIQRASTRNAFGHPIIKLGANPDIIADCKAEIEMARLLVLKTAWLLDTDGILGAKSEVAMIKYVVPRMACKVIDHAIQMFGGMGLSDDVPLAAMYAYARVLRLADGPDEVHQKVVAKREIKKVLGL